MKESPCTDDHLCDYGEEYFEGYIAQTVDPGPTLLIATSIFCALMLTALCILITMKKILDSEKRKQIDQMEATSDEATREKNKIDRKVEKTEVEEMQRARCTMVGRKKAVLKDKRRIGDEEVGQSIISQESINYDTSVKQSLPAQSGRSRRRRGRRLRATRMLDGLFKDDEKLSLSTTFHMYSDDNFTDEEKKCDNNSSSSSSSSSVSTVLDEYKLEGSLFNILLRIVEWDSEMKRLFQIGVPFTLQALTTGILDIVSAAVVGKLLGSRELAAFVVASMCIELSAGILGGVHEALNTLCSQAIGVGNSRLAGQYVQLSFLTYIIMSIPFAVIWWIYIVPVMAWFGFDEETTIIGRDYSRILIFDLFVIEGLGESIHGLLDVADHETYSMIVGIAEETLAIVGICVIAFFGKPSLTDIGYLELSLGVIFLGFNIIYITCKGWFRPYYGGMLRSCALYNTKAIWLMMKTGTSLTLGILLTEAEWEIFTILASFLGPAEVAAWGVVGTIWGAVESLIESIGDAAEVRAAFLLGTGQYERAKASAYKSILVSMYAAVLLTSGLYICGDNLPLWMTNDPTLQYMIRDLLPLMGWAFIVLTLGDVCWTLIGAQGRYHMATVFVIIGSTLFTLPLGILFSIVLNFNLQGQITAIIVGYVVSGSANIYLLFTTDWCEASKRIIEENSELTSDDSSSESSDSCPSSISTTSGLNKACPENQPVETKLLQPEFQPPLSPTLYLV